MVSFKNEGTAWNGSRGWTYGPPIVFVVAFGFILLRSFGF